MIRHDDPGMEMVASVVEKPQGFGDQIRYFGSFQPALALARIKEMLKLAKIISLDFFHGIIGLMLLPLFLYRWLVLKSVEPFGAFCLNFKQHIFRQGIVESKGYEIARSLAFDMRKKTAGVNARAKAGSRFWFDAISAKFEFYAIKPWILLGGDHGVMLKRRVDQRQWRRFADGGVLGDSMPLNCSRSAECNSAIQQIENLRYGPALQNSDKLFTTVLHIARINAAKCHHGMK
jgi:hypothetical protein